MLSSPQVPVLRPLRSPLARSRSFRNAAFPSFIPPSLARSPSLGDADPLRTRPFPELTQQSYLPRHRRLGNLKQDQDGSKERGYQHLICDWFIEPVIWGLYIFLELLTPIINSERDCTANQRTPNNEVGTGTLHGGIPGANTRGFSLSTVDGGRRARLSKA